MLDDSCSFVQCLYPPRLWKWGESVLTSPLWMWGSCFKWDIHPSPGACSAKLLHLGWAPWLFGQDKPHLEVPLPLMTMACSNSLHSFFPFLMGCEKDLSSGAIARMRSTAHQIGLQEHHPTFLCFTGLLMSSFLLPICFRCSYFS